MKVSLQPALNDGNLDGSQPNSQRQLAISISAVADNINRNVPLNLCLILDHSGSMSGRPLETVKKAACRIVDRLNPGDRLSVVVFDHRAKVLVSNQTVDDPERIKQQINKLSADGGTAIDEGLQLGIKELTKGNKESISQAFLLTDGENEHGSNKRCLEFAKLAASYNLTLNTLGFGDNWNQDVLEQIADAGGGALSHIQRPDEAEAKFNQLFTRIQTVSLTNAYLLFSLVPKVRFAELKPVAQVAPETIELPVQQDPDGRLSVRIGDLMRDVERVILANLYISQLPIGRQPIAQLQVRYDDPSQNTTGILSEIFFVEANVTGQYQSVVDPNVQQHVLALAKYRQTQLAETKLQMGDRAGAATMLQTAAKTALQMGDMSAATVLQTSATQLQAGQDLSEADRKKTRIVSKTILQDS
ncbi:von Willebrand factor type A [Calothrix sp. NIES-4071]|nr:von Willebrand factor type A [Calothrix sp. NIES-4071]BAZ59322.1 von Willebrand factor type A [Calothrix sp. NIES-4105]